MNEIEGGKKAAGYVLLTTYAYCISSLHISLSRSRVTLQIGQSS